MSEIRVLTVRQPWAWAIIHGGKDVENRVRNIAGDYRGPVAIHVAHKVASVTFAQYRTVEEEGYDASAEENRGHIIGVVDLVDVHHWSECLDGVFGCSPWAQTDSHHLVLANPRPVDPIPYKGALGLRRITDPLVIEKLTATPKESTHE